MNWRESTPSLAKFTKHAKEQIAQRGLTQEEVISVISNPVKTVPTRANRLASYGRVEGKYIVVIHEHEEDDELVVTAMKVDRARLARFGFIEI